MKNDSVPGGATPGPSGSTHSIENAPPPQSPGGCLVRLTWAMFAPAAGLVTIAMIALRGAPGLGSPDAAAGVFAALAMGARALDDAAIRPTRPTYAASVLVVGLALWGAARALAGWLR